MEPILVLYATREGHTRRIAGYLAASLTVRGFAPEVVDAAHLPAGFSLRRYAGAILGASVHRGKHEAEIANFVKRHRDELAAIPTAFLSVSLSEAGAEGAEELAERRAQAAADVERMIDAFLTETGWHPARIKAVAGALLYTKYNLLLRIVMKRIALQSGGGTDTTRDYDYTDWKSLDDFVDEFTRSIPVHEAESSPV
jgi:menaquinone-dependent protoporphyrinogen oxidase